MDDKQFQELSEKHSEIIEYMHRHKNMVDWFDVDRANDVTNLIFAAIPDVIQSYCATETYMLNNKFRIRR